MPPVDRSQEPASFLRGTLIITLATGIVRLIGVVQRIPLYHLIGPQGVGLYAAAYAVYTILLAVSSSGVNVAIARLVAARLATGDRAGARRLFRVSLALAFGLGLSFSLALAAASPWLAADLFLDDRARLSFLAVSPAILIVSLMAVYRGWFQGQQRMTPYAISEIVEQVGRVAVMLALAYVLLGRGIEWAAAGATFGAASGAAAGLAYLAWVHGRTGPGRAGRGEGGDRIPAGFQSEALEIARVALPISMTAAVLPLMGLLDAAIIPARLRVAGFSPEEATALYGQLTTVPTSLVNLPTILTTALFASLIPAIAAAAALGQRQLIRARTRIAFRLAVLATLPAALGLHLLAEPITTFLFADPSAAAPLRALAPAALLLPLQQTSSGVLQGLGLTTLPVRHLLIGTGVKVVLTWTLTARPELGISGAALGTAAGFGVAAGLNVLAIRLRLGPILDFDRLLLRPVLALAAMAIVVPISYRLALGVWPAVGAATLAAILAGGAVYVLILFLTGSLRPTDLTPLPLVGPALASRLERASGGRPSEHP